MLLQLQCIVNEPGEDVDDGSSLMAVIGGDMHAMSAIEGGVEQFVIRSSCCCCCCGGG